MRRMLALAASPLAALVILALLSFRGDVRAQSAGGCPQWEVMLAQPPPILTVPVSEIGKPVIEKAPAGWEPFAFAPSGQLVYRRCAR
jgi:hypothetical protein